MFTDSVYFLKICTDLQKIVGEQFLFWKFFGRDKVKQYGPPVLLLSDGVNLGEIARGLIFVWLTESCIIRNQS